jgi:hypothetical protein
MKNNKSTRAFYIILVPVVLVVVLLNSGFLQARVPAVTISGARYNVSQFNYYYFTAYNDFVAENFDESGENGPFDQTVALRTQMKEGDTSWRDYFISLAEERMVEVTYYSTQASVNGYDFSQEELAPVEETLAQVNADSTDAGVTLKNYLVAYWGVGMTEDTFTEELTRSIQADAYKAYLETSADVENAALSDRTDASQEDSYLSANLTMIQLNAAEDRFTGEVGETQIADLSEKLARLNARYEADPDTLLTLAENFNDNETLAKNQGQVENATKTSLPAVVADWVFAADTSIGDHCAVVDEEAGQGYLVVLSGWGVDAAQQDALEALRQETVEADLEEVRQNTTLGYNSLGKRLIGR